MSSALPPFHLAIPVRDLTRSRPFYGELLGCPEGRSSESWVDFNFFGHQLVCHVSEAEAPVDTSPVDGHGVPVPHFGAVLDMDSWTALAGKLREAGVVFVIEPYVRFKGQAGEQATMFFRDPSGNPIEIKAFRDIETELFRK
jgi:extradiol dioxygenase family protein